MNPKSIIKNNKANGCFVVRCHDDDPEDAEQVALNSQLAHLFDVVLQVRHLESGITDGVDGQVTVFKSPHYSAAQNVTCGSLFYRLNESGIEWLSKGSMSM